MFFDGMNGDEKSLRADVEFYINGIAKDDHSLPQKQRINRLYRQIKRRDAQIGRFIQALSARNEALRPAAKQP